LFSSAKDILVHSNLVLPNLVPNTLLWLLD